MLRILLLLFLSLLLFLPIFVAAQETFVSLTEGGIPGVPTGASPTGAGFSNFLNAAFKIGLAAAATLAVVMITIGGLQYMTTDSVYNKTEGKDKIQNAVVGLLIALLIWLILFTINPNLLKFDIKIKGVILEQSELGDFNISNKGGRSFKPPDSEPTFNFGGPDGDIQPAPNTNQLPGEDEIIELQRQTESKKVSDETNSD